MVDAHALVMLQRLLVSEPFGPISILANLSSNHSSIYTPLHLIPLPPCDPPSFLNFVPALCPPPPSLLSGAGADFVMLGGMLAGHTQSGGEIIERDGKKFKLFYGMSSATAMQKYSGGVAEYR